MHILALHDCHYLPTNAADSLIVLARVAGFDTALFGLPKERFPILFRTKDGVLVATTKLSNFLTARYAPTEDWLVVWRHLLAEVDPDGAPHQLVAQASVHPAYRSDESLPENAERQALDRVANWYKQSRLLISAEREGATHELLKQGQDLTPPPANGASGDGTLGILEGYASQIGPDGGQMQRTPIRADCQAEAAAVLARINGRESRRTLAQYAWGALKPPSFRTHAAQRRCTVGTALACAGTHRPRRSDNTGPTPSSRRAWV